MIIRVEGIDTTNDQLMSQFLNTVMQTFPTYNGVSLNIVDATTLEIELG